VKAPASWPNSSLQQLRRDRRGVERDEGPLRARRFAVQRARDQLLAGAGLAGDQHRQRRLRQAADGAEQLAHRRRLADQSGESPAAAVAARAVVGARLAAGRARASATASSRSKGLDRNSCAPPRKAPAVLATSV
jgi:hypothetical protein